jgi:transcriptional regulator with XRE-family HTH domain
MRNVELGKVGRKIRQLRKERSMNLQEVADKSDITAGLLSRIENFRTLPSLPVLHNISMALNVPLAELVDLVGSNGASNYVLVRKGQANKEEREDSQGLFYENILSTSLGETNIQVSIVSVPSQTYRKPLTNDCMELVYIVKGELEYALGENKLKLQEGDTLFFDGGIPHSLHNTAAETAVLFKVYLLRRR